MSARKLVIVESPAKARTIAGFLGADFDVTASVGHIRDLPTPSELPKDMKKGPFGKFAVNVDEGFTPYYVVDADKKKRVSELKAKLKQADELYLATDEDREGEAIAWHLLEVLKPKVPVKRMVFHEITREAITRALENTRDIDDRLVDAQETRRILDRLYGYEVSPVLWRKIRQGTSAGRVQSVATRLVVDRERERMAFCAAGYFDVVGTFGTEPSFAARLVVADGAKIATGRDFDDSGALTPAATKAGVTVLDEAGAQRVVAALDGADFIVRSVETKPYTRRPAAPFTTSTLQQEASRKLRLNSSRTMRVAQTLYENGYITYMRTDSPALAATAIAAARAQAAALYGANLVAAKPRVYTAKSASAQEAHEAIRPAGDTFRTPEQLHGVLKGDELRLYDLIWKRTIASQMADAKGSTASVRLEAQAGGVAGEFAASGTTVTFRGFLAAYEESSDEANARTQVHLPELAAGDVLASRDLQAEGHTTNPPARYTEASLIRALEERGIGRPSTYAATVGVIADRGYVTGRGQALVPTWLAFATIQLLEKHFDWLVDYDFTAEMEADLDQIAAGEKDRVAWLTRFYFGDGSGRTEGEGLRDLTDDLDEIDAREVNSVPVGEGLLVRVGRYGPYVEVPPASAGEAPVLVNIPDSLTPDEVTPEVIAELVVAASRGDTVVGEDPDTGHVIVARDGRYGPYVTELLGETETGKARTASLLKTQQIATLTLPEALALLSLPRVVGVDPATGAQITARIGRYGPYLQREKESRSLASEDEVFTIDLPAALALLAAPKTRGARTPAAALRELGADPATGATMTVRDGRFGPYVTDGTTNATLGKEEDPATITAERAAELLAIKRAKPPARKRSTAKGAKGSKTAKSTRSKRST